MTTEGHPLDRPTFVLGSGVVRWAIDQLVGQRIHPFFPAYIAIRRAAGQRESLEGIHPRWEDLEQFLRVPGGPPRKPNFRPFWHQSSAAGQHWLNANLAGSYAPSSVRTVPRRVIALDNSGGFALGEHHWELAREHLLFKDRLSATALCAFLYRDFGFTTDGRSPQPDDLIEIFRHDFGYHTGIDDVEFDHLYSKTIPERSDWFEPFEPTSTSD